MLAQPPPILGAGYATPSRVPAFPVAPPPQMRPAPPLPMPNLDFEPARRLIREQTEFLSQFADKVKARVEDRKYAFSLQMARDREEYAKISQEIEDLEASELDINAALERENDEESAAKTTVSELLRRKAELDSARKDLQERLKTLEETVQARKEELESRRSRRFQEASLNDPEVKAYEATLGMKIVSLRDGVLKIVFTNINEHFPDCEYSFIVDVREKEYIIPEHQPSLAELPELTRQLNETRDFYGFVKAVRRAFSEQAKGTLVGR